MKISAIAQSETNCCPRRNLFIRFSNSFMSSPEVENPIEKACKAQPSEIITEKKPAKMGIEQLEEFTIFPKEIVEGKTIITA